MVLYTGKSCKWRLYTMLQLRFATHHIPRFKIVRAARDGKMGAGMMLLIVLRNKQKTYLDRPRLISLLDFIVPKA